jgi:EmrB/QacA subfamily drug resistance transporter
VIEHDEFPVLTHRQTVAIFCSLMLGMLLAALDQTIVSTALPRITGDLGGLEHISWVISSYLLTATIGMPLYGKLGDLFGRKLLFQIAIAVFLVGSVLSGFSQSMTELIAFRAVQGLGAGGLLVLAMTIIGETVSPRERGRYQGYFGAMFGLSSVAGPLIGGFITDNLSWRWVFYVNLPLGILALVLVAAVLPKGTRHEKPVIDWAGAALLTVTVLLIVLITTWGGVEYEWGSTLIVGLIAVAVVLLGVTIAVERKAAEPMLPVRLFRIPTFSVSTIVSFIVGVAMFGSIGFLPLYLQAVTGASATNSGLALFPMMGGVVISSVIAGRFITRTGKYKAWPVAGTAIATVGIVLLSTIGAHTSSLIVSAFMFVLGTGIGMVMQIMVMTAQNAVPLQNIGAATGTINFCREIGGCIGIAAFGAVFTSGLHSRLGSFDMHSSGLSIDVIKQLPEAEQVRVIGAIADSVANVFEFAIPVMAAAFAVAWFLKEIPLRGGGASPVEHPATVEVVPEPALERAS